MPAPSNAQADSAAELKAKIQPSLPWRVTSVQPLPNYRLKVRFIDGLEGEVDMRPLLRSSKAGVFAALGNRELFEKVGLRWGAVTWPGELDLAPDAMYDDIKAKGVCVVGAFED